METTKPTKSPTELYVLIKTLEANLYDGNAKAISCINSKGSFDVLPHHENFITIIKDKITVYGSIDPITGMGKDKKEFPIDSAILKISENTIYVFVGVTELG